MKTAENATMSLEFHRVHIPSCSLHRSGDDGQITGQEAPHRHGPYGFCGVDAIPEITSPSEKSGPIINPGH